MLLCPRCRRVNPDEAGYCHFDGIDLRAGSGLGDQEMQVRLPQEFVFPSGRACRSFDTLIQGCLDEWDAACKLLEKGVFEQFMASGGRMDLARAAQAARTQTDLDVALATFLGKLPASTPLEPHLDLHPRRIALGTLHAGDTRRVVLRLTNQGQGLLRGSVAVSDGSDWLRIGSEPNPDQTERTTQVAIKTIREQRIVLHIDTRGLTPPQRFSGKLTVISNGGAVEVPVRFDLEAQPFPRPPFRGARTPRAMAERMRANPKQAAPFLEAGEVARWFQANGWSYPVDGPTARGVAAVQQFFEAMGLSRPPAVELSETEIHLECRPPRRALGQVKLRTSAKKWVYGFLSSDVPWLHIPEPSVSGPQQAQVNFVVEPGELEAGQRHTGAIRVHGNAGQTLTLAVSVHVRPPPESAARRTARAILVGGLAALLFRVLLAVPADLAARLWLALPPARIGLHAENGDAPVSPQPGSFAAWREPLSDSGFVRNFILATSWIGMACGAILVWRRGRRWTDVPGGIIAGGTAGLIGAGTLACLVPLVDALPHWLAARASEWLDPRRIGNSVWLGTAAWIALAAVSWGMLGAATGLLLSCTGQPGGRLLSSVVAPLAGFFRLCGLHRLAMLFRFP